MKMNKEYLDHGQLKYDFNLFKAESVNSEDEALSILLGLNVEQFAQFRYLYKKKDRFDKSASYFIRAYMSFLDDYYQLRYSAFHQVMDFYHKAKEICTWRGSFENYAQDLYDLGFIFKFEIFDKLQIKGIDLRYSKEGPVYRFYKHWIYERYWTLRQTTELVKGINSRDKSKVLKDLNPHHFFLENDFTRYKFRTLYPDTVQILEYHYEDALDSGELKRFLLPGRDEVFEPQDILNWVVNTTNYNAPGIFLMFSIDFKFYRMGEESGYKFLPNKCRKPLKLNWKYLVEATDFPYQK